MESKENKEKWEKEEEWDETAEVRHHYHHRKCFRTASHFSFASTLYCSLASSCSGKSLRRSQFLFFYF